MYYDSLTKQEREVMKYVVWGLSNAEISRMMSLCEGRVAAIACNLYAKYGIMENHRSKLIVSRLKEIGIDTKELTA